MIISSTNAFILQHRVHIHFKKQSSFDIKHKPCWRRHLELTRSAPNARTRDCERLDHIRMIRSAMTNDTEHRSHLSGSNAERQITWSGWSGASRLHCRTCPQCA